MTHARRAGSVPRVLTTSSTTWGWKFSLVLFNGAEKLSLIIREYADQAMMEIEYIKPKGNLQPTPKYPVYNIVCSLSKYKFKFQKIMIDDEDEFGCINEKSARAASNFVVRMLAHAGLIIMMFCISHSGTT